MPKDGTLENSVASKHQNINTDTLLLDSPDGQQSLNSLFPIPTTESVLDHIQILLDEHPDAKDTIHNIYNLPSIEQAIRYLHAAADFLTKSTLLEAIRNDNYLLWPLFCVKSVSKYLPECEKSQSGDMIGQ